MKNQTHFRKKSFNTSPKTPNYSSISGQEFTIVIQERDKLGQPIGEKKVKELFLKYQDKDNAFRVYQKGWLFGSKNIQPEVAHAIKSVLGEKYCDYVGRKADSNHLLLDASSLKKLYKSDNVIVDKMSKADVNALAHSDEQDRKYLEKEPCLSKELLNKHRIFRNDSSRRGEEWKVCIDRRKEIYLSAQDDDLPVLSEYLKGNALLRRKYNFPTQTVPLSKIAQRRRFQTLERKSKYDDEILFFSEDKTTILLNRTVQTVNSILDGEDVFSPYISDGASSVLANAGFSEQTISLTKSLALFPIFFAVTGSFLFETARGYGASLHSLPKVEENIVSCKEKIEKIDDIVRNIQSATKNKNISEEEKQKLYSALQEALSTIVTLHNNIKLLQQELFDYKNIVAEFYGSVLFFSTTMSETLEQFMNLLGGVDTLSKGLESSTFVQSLNLHGGSLWSNISMDAPFGLIGLLSNPFALIAQIIFLSIFANLAYDNAKKIVEINKDLKDITSSSMMSDLIKETVKAFKKDERLFRGIKATGEILTSSGFIASILSGPFGFAVNPGAYAGLALFFSGFVVEKTAILRDKTLYAYDKEMSLLEKTILSESSSTVFKELVKDIQKETRKQEVNGIIKTVLHSNNKLKLLTEDDLESIFNPTLTKKKRILTPLLQEEEHRKTKLKQYFSALFQLECKKKGLHFTPMEKNGYIQQNGMRTKSALEYIGSSSLFKETPSYEKYTQLARESSFQLEFLTHLQTIPLVTNKVFKESLKHTSSYEKAVKHAKSHYSSRNHQKGLLETLEDTSLPQQIVDILNHDDASKKYQMKKILLWHNVTEKLKPTIADAKWIKTVGSLLSTFKQDTTDIRTLISQINDVTTLPKDIKQYLYSLKQCTYKDIITALQQVYIDRKLCHFNVEKYNKMSLTTLKKELSENILDNDNLSAEFKQRVMQHAYIKENRYTLRSAPCRKQQYLEKKNNTPIHIIGQLTKINTGLFKGRDHRKNVYAFNANSIRKGYFTPETSLFRSVLNKDNKYKLRSAYHRGIRLLSKNSAIDTTKVAQTILSDIEDKD